MNIADLEMERNELDASPERFANVSPHRRPSHEIERIITASSTSTSSSISSARRQERIMSRTSTQGDLERHPTVLSRIHTARSQHTATVGRQRSMSTKTRDTRRPLPEMGLGKPYPPPLPSRDEYVVEFEGPDDPLHAQNWPMKKKIFTAVILGYTTLVSSFTSSIFSTATTTIAAQYHVSTEVGLLGLSLYVLGFAFGPVFWAPLSELQGRRLPLVISMFGFSIFQVAVAAGKDLQTILLCRFWGGMFGAAPLAIVAAVFSDMFDNKSRGLAITVFSMTVFTGPLLAPFIGGFIVESHLGWRWTEWLVAIMGFFAFFLDFFFLEETYPPVILISKASELRRRTRNWGIHAKQEEIEIDFRELITKNFSRPMRILFTEPIILLLSIYMSFIYGLLYLFLTAYPIVFQQIHRMTPGIGGLPYFGMVTGQLLAGIYIALTQPSYNRKLAANNGVPIPEWRLPPVIIGGISFAGGLFWFGWSGYRADIHWIVPTLSGILTGFGLLAIFLQSLNYIVDAYLMFAASAIAGNTFLRSLAGAGFPMFSQYMFKALHVNWAGTLLGCVATVLIPIPVCFYFYGEKLRRKSAFAPTKPEELPIHDEDDTAAGVEKRGEDAV
ncbi:putative fluconazole resistance protein [Venustampulla echinocandica]|uniref:Putative fluconazole resistance protein n=1 Tax=Venustampulla echinocandica TaxID=2656787 RepID=A0A370TU97_9HELO|nr:putative fluconazole resistance protein [Venustampulla echinocandica]RDL39105.1 putative fluconazole resistance protein [Venustampulla echinocandica]